MMTWALLAVLVILLAVLLVAHRRGEFILWRPEFLSVTGAHGARMALAGREAYRSDLAEVSVDGAVRAYLAKIDRRLVPALETLL